MKIKKIFIVIVSIVLMISLCGTSFAMGPGMPEPPSPPSMPEPPSTPEPPPSTPEPPPSMPDSPPSMPETQPSMPNTPPSMPNTPPSMPNTPPNMPNTPPSMPNTPPNMPNTPPNMPNIPGMPTDMPKMPGNMTMPTNIPSMPTDGIPKDLNNMFGGEMPFIPGQIPMPSGIEKPAMPEQKDIEAMMQTMNKDFMTFFNSGSSNTTVKPDFAQIKLPENIKVDEFQKMTADGKVDFMTQEMVKGLNPGKFGSMLNPYAVSERAGLFIEEGKFILSEGTIPNASIVEAMKLKESGKFDDSSKLLNEVLNQYPDARVRALIGEIQMEKGDLKTALNEFEGAVAMAPNDSDLYLKAGKVLEELGEVGPKVFVNGVKPEFDVSPQIVEGRTMVPFKAIAESLGADVAWDGEKREVTLTIGDKNVVLPIDSTTAYFNGEPTKIDVPAKIVEGRTMVPVAFISESLGAEVDWIPEYKVVKIIK